MNSANLNDDFDPTPAFRDVLVLCLILIGTTLILFLAQCNEPVPARSTYLQPPKPPRDWNLTETNHGKRLWLDEVHQGVQFKMAEDPVTAIN